MISETVTLGTTAAKARTALRKGIVREMVGKTTTDAVLASDGEEIIPAATLLTEARIDAALNSDAKEIKVRNGSVRSIKVEATLPC